MSSIDSIKEGFLTQIGRYAVMGFVALACAYTVTVVGGFKSDILIAAAKASGEQIEGSTYMIQADIASLKLANEKHATMWDKENIARKLEVDGKLESITNKMEANRKEAKADTAAVGKKVDTLQGVLIEEIRENR